MSVLLVTDSLASWKEPQRTMGTCAIGDDGTLNFSWSIKSRICDESELLEFQTDDIEATGISED